MGPPDILVAIVNFRTPALVGACLDSLAPEMWANPTARAIVVDNASGDDSVTAIPAAIRAGGHGDWCRFVEAPRNGGFAYGNNVAVEAARDGAAGYPRLTWLLNPDTIVHPGALTELVRFMAAHPQVGIAGGLSEDESGAPIGSAFRFPSVLSELERGVGLGLVTRLLHRHVVSLPPADAPGPVDWVSGASMMIRGEVFAAIGLLDDAYFMYFEEVDFCHRARAAGFPCWHVPASRIVHLIGQASGIASARAERKRRPAYWFASRSRYFRRNRGRAGLIAANLAWLGGHPLGRLKERLIGRPSLDPPWFWWDTLRHSLRRSVIRDGK